MTAEGPRPAGHPTSVPPALFDRMVGRIVTEHGVNRLLAERILTEAEAFLRACVGAPVGALTPAQMEDIAWRIFVLYSPGPTTDRDPGASDAAARPAIDERGHDRLHRALSALVAVGHVVHVEPWRRPPPCPADRTGHGCARCRTAGASRRTRITT